MVMSEIKREQQKEYHVPVMSEEIIDYLALTPGKVIVDATVGTGGHSMYIIKGIVPGGRLIGIDRDEESLAIAKERLFQAGAQCDFVYGNFVDIDTILRRCNVTCVDGIVFDLGLSSYQLRNPERGFSFQSEGPLDMRMDRHSCISAYDLLNNLNEQELSSLLWSFGQERWHNRIAKFVVKERERHPITTTRELSNIVLKAIPYKYRGLRIHPATRTFQAVRIAVNSELESLESAITKAIALLSSGGRLCVISFHSLEDRAVKLIFRQEAAQERISIITAKPRTASPEEVRDNPLSRSAKLRVAQKV